MNAGLIEPSRRSARRPFPTYSLAAGSLAGMGRAVTYHRRGADGIDQKVVQHVNEYGHITNQTLRRLFDLNVYQARDLLRDMQTRQLLGKIDDKTAGPGVRYGPGPKFSDLKCSAKKGAKKQDAHTFPPLSKCRQRRPRGRGDTAYRMEAVAPAHVWHREHRGSSVAVANPLGKSPTRPKVMV